MATQAPFYLPAKGITKRRKIRPQPEQPVSPLGATLVGRKALWRCLVHLGLLFLLMGLVSFSLPGFLFFHQNFLLAGIGGLLGIWCCLPSTKFTRLRHLGQSGCLTLAELLPCLGRFQSMLAGGMVMFFGLAAVCFLAFLVTYGGGPDNLAASSVFTARAHYFLTDHGQLTEVSRLRFVNVTVLACGFVYFGMMGLALLGIYRLVFEKPVSLRKTGE